MEAEGDFFNTPFYPSVSKDNQMRGMLPLCACVCEIRLQNNFPILVPEGWGKSGKRNKAWDRKEAGSHWGLMSLLMIMFLLSCFIEARLKPEGMW